MSVHPLRAINRSRVLGAVIDSAPGSRADLARRLGLSAMGVTRVVRELVEAGLVKETEPSAGSEPGRPPAGLAIDPAGAFVLGFEIHAFAQSIVLMDLSRQIARRSAVHLSDPANGARSLSEFAEQAISEIRSAGIDPHRVMGTGVAVTGTVDRNRGTLAGAPYLGWAPLDIAGTLQSRLDMPIIVDRVANAFLAAESRTPAGILSDALLVNVGFGMSAAFLVGGEIARGDALIAGQIGHMQAGDAKRLCSCGQRGCLNAVASGWAALADLGDIDAHVQSADEFQRNRPKLTNLLQRESAGDPTACQALERVGRLLGRTVRQIQIALNPSRIFLSGPVGRAISYVEGVRHGIDEDAAVLVERCERKGDEAAALLALDEFVRSPRMDFERLHGAGRRQVNAVA